MSFRYRVGSIFRYYFPPQLVYNCNILPKSMSGKGHPKGCPGAVSGSGKPSRKYCGGDKGQYPWWKECCVWQNGECRAEGNI